jgi:hypothetical protein
MRKRPPLRSLLAHTSAVTTLDTHAEQLTTLRTQPLHRGQRLNQLYTACTCTRLSVGRHRCLHSPLQLAYTG